MIQFSCSGCGTSYSVSDDKAGKSGRCKKCQTPFTVPQPQAASPPPPPAPEPVPDEPPTKKAVARRPAAEPEDDVDERPRKKTIKRTPSAPSPLARTLGTLRRSQLLDFTAFGTLVLVGIVATVLLTIVANSKQAARAAEWDRRSDEWRNDLARWDSTPWNTRGPRPERPGDLPKWKPAAGAASRDMLSENGWIFTLFALPASVIVLSGVYSALGRFRMAAIAVGSGGSRGFALVGVLSVGRTLLGILSCGGCVWAMTQVDPNTNISQDGPELVSAAVGGLILAMYVGVLGEVFALPALVLVGWHFGISGQHRHRIGLAAAFYPFIAIVWFVITLTLALLAILLPDLRVIAIVIQACLFIAMQVLQYLVVTRAYRFPAEPQPEAPKPE